MVCLPESVHDSLWVSTWCIFLFSACSGKLIVSSKLLFMSYSCTATVQNIQTRHMWLELKNEWEWRMTRSIHFCHMCLSTPGLFSHCVFPCQQLSAPRPHHYSTDAPGLGTEGSIPAASNKGSGRSNAGKAGESWFPVVWQCKIHILNFLQKCWVQTILRTSKHHFLFLFQLVWLSLFKAWLL